MIKPQRGGGYLLYIEPTKDFYPEYTQNSEKLMNNNS